MCVQKTTENIETEEGRWRISGWEEGQGVGEEKGEMGREEEEQGADELGEQGGGGEAGARVLDTSS